MNASLGNEGGERKEQTANLKKEHTQIENKIDTLVDLLMDKVIDKVKFEVKKKRLKDRQHQIDPLIREADDAFNEKLLNLVEFAARAISHFKGSDIGGAPTFPSHDAGVVTED